MKSIVENYLQEFDLKYEIVENPEHNITIIFSEVGIPSGILPIRIILDWEAQQTCIFTYYPLAIPITKRKNIAELITRINYGLMSGSFRLDFNDGEIGFHCNFYFSDDITQAEELLTTKIYLALSNIEEYLPGIYAVVYGDKAPVDALSNIHYNTNPRLN